LKQIGNINEKEVLKVLKYIDQGKTGFLEFEEFVRACINKQKLLNEENLKISFTLFNKTGIKKVISCQDFKNILGLQTKFSNKTWEKIINQIDINGDGQIEFNEYKEMMLKFLNP
jgi:calcium-dependent protein kinase